MAKKQVHCSVRFHFDDNYTTIEDAVYKQITLKPGGMRFFHIERKGNTWLVLDALEFAEEGCSIFQIPFTRETVQSVPQTAGFAVGENDVKISIYTVLHLPGDELYHMDELPDGTWRITHTANMLNSPHASLNSITVDFRHV